MPEISINSLKDKALDVDPDLRFMALEDFKKYLSEPTTTLSTKSIESFIPLLFRLLKDTNANVQSQAVKSFSPIIKFIPAESILKLLNQLYEEILKENVAGHKDYKKITTSIPNMTLRSIFNSNSKFSNRLSRSIIDSFIPKLINNPITIDSIELLIDLIKNLGFVLTNNEISSLLDTTMNIAFDEESIIGKRSVIAFDSLLNYLDNSETSNKILNELVNRIYLKFDSLPRSTHSINLRFSLFAVILNSAKTYDDYDGSLFDDATVRCIFNTSVTYMKVDELVTELDIQDYDFDLMIQENLIRENAFNIINDLVNSLPLEMFGNYLNDTIQLIKTFVGYDPLNFDRDEDEVDLDEDSEIEFSDDEDDINNSDELENDCSWKLRDKSTILTRSLTNRYPSVLTNIYSELVPSMIQAMSDRNDIVSNDSIKTLIAIINCTCLNTKESSTVRKLGRSGSDVSMTLEDNPIHQLFTNVSPILESKIFNNLLVSKNINRFPIFLKLIESLISANHQLSTEFLNKIFSVITNLNLKTSGNMEYLSLYKTIFLNNELTEVTSDFVIYILYDLSKSMDNKTSYHNIIMESLNISIIIFQNFENITSLDDFQLAINNLFNSITKICHDKQYSSELRQRSIIALSSLTVNIEVSEENFIKTVDILRESLNYEATVKVTIESLTRILDKKCKNFWSFIKEASFINILISKMTAFISSTDDSLYYLSLKLLDTITNIQPVENLEDEQVNKLLSLLINFSNSTNDYTQLYLSFNVVGRILPICQTDDKFLQALIKILNEKLVDVDDFDLASFEFMIQQLSRKLSNEHLSEKFMNNLDLTLFISAKTMSIITIENNLHDKIADAEFELNSYINGDITASNDKILFDIQFLGCIGSQNELKLISLPSFLQLLRNKNEAIRLASSRSIGLIIVKDLEKNLPLLLENYELNNEERDLNLISMKQLLKNDMLNNSVLLEIWDRIWDANSRYDERKITNTTELRLSGDVLSRICLLNHDFIRKTIDKIDNTSNESIIYTIIVILKQLMHKLEDNNKLLELLLIANLKFLPLSNIEIKQALIGTLLTSLHNKPDLLLPILPTRVLPLIYDELSAKDEFKKVIPMGPYKYVIDEGLEIRKLCYEFLYTIILTDDSLLRAYNINIHEVGLTIVNKGLTDNETDVVILSSINLVNLVNKDFTFLVYNNDLLPKLIDVLKLNLNKKLKSKASTQETETFEEGLRSVVKLSKVINNCLIINNYNNNDWNLYYSELKTNFILTFNSVDI